MAWISKKTGAFLSLHREWEDENKDSPEHERREWIEDDDDLAAWVEDAVSERQHEERKEWALEVYAKRMTILRALLAAEKAAHEKRKAQLEAKVKNLDWWLLPTVKHEVLLAIEELPGKKKPKGIMTAYGRLGFRKVKAGSRDVTDKDAAMAWAKENDCPEAIKTKESLLVSFLPKAGEVPGTTLRTEDTFSFTVAK